MPWTVARHTARYAGIAYELNFLLGECFDFVALAKEDGAVYRRKHVRKHKRTDEHPHQHKNELHDVLLTQRHLFPIQ
jgi:hypothetical protein